MTLNLLQYLMVIGPLCSMFVISDLCPKHRVVCRRAFLLFCCTGMLNQFPVQANVEVTPLPVAQPVAQPNHELITFAFPKEHYLHAYAER